MLNPQEILATWRILRYSNRGSRSIQAVPRQLAVRHIRLLSVDLKPHAPTAVPVGRRLAGWHLGHVELQRALVEDVRGDLEGYAATSCYARGAGSPCARAELVASDGGRGDVGHGAVGVVVCGCADGGPVCCAGDGGEEVCCC
jgi:hypothetical protein